ncbi:hypothetical protein BRD00_10985 [Halobacteriales archaeon QS_8_69_26]|nr:MAG: hypothetical protein BRD00_10985 [Halobacteriales archaeon QS_8_69_26]
MAIAFGAQLAVLPGEKGQFIIAGLSTRYDPKVVVGAAATAFAGWTALEILAGKALQGALPGPALDVLTAGMFLLFASLLWRSIPEEGETLAETDGGAVEDERLDVRIPLLDRPVPTPFGGFLPIFALMAAGEFGDKTQIVTIGLAAQYGATPAIWAGEMLAIVPVSLANAYFFDRFSERVNLRKVHVGSAVLFLFFGLDTLAGLLFGVSVWETAVEGVGRLFAVLAGVA